MRCYGHAEHYHLCIQEFTRCVGGVDENETSIERAGGDVWVLTLGLLSPSMDGLVQRQVQLPPPSASYHRYFLCVLGVWRVLSFPMLRMHFWMSSHVWKFRKLASNALDYSLRLTAQWYKPAFLIRISLLRNRYVQGIILPRSHSSILYILQATKVKCASKLSSSVCGCCNLH